MVSEAAFFSVVLMVIGLAMISLGLLLKIEQLNNRVGWLEAKFTARKRAIERGGQG